MSKVLITSTALLESQQQPKNFLPLFFVSLFISQSSIRGVASAILLFVHVEDNLRFDQYIQTLLPYSCKKYSLVGAGVLAHFLLRLYVMIFFGGLHHLSVSSPVSGSGNFNSSRQSIGTSTAYVLRCNNGNEPMASVHDEVAYDFSGSVAFLRRQDMLLY